MADTTENLEHVYTAEDSGSIRQTYQDWAGSYDTENISGGFRLPQMGAAFVARHVARDAGAILDAGCGTGLVGEAMSILGYGQITGTDISPAMMRQAETLGAYSRLFEHDLGQPLPENDDSYAAVTCFGSLGPGHAPASCLEEFIRVTRPGGHVVLNVRPETYTEQGLKARIEALSAEGKWQEIDRSPIFRPYLISEPDLGAQIFVFRVG